MGVGGAPRVGGWARFATPGGGGLPPSPRTLRRVHLAVPTPTSDSVSRDSRRRALLDGEQADHLSAAPPERARGTKRVSIASSHSAVGRTFKESRPRK
jgi:hypothetical protein